MEEERFKSFVEDIFNKFLTSTSTHEVDTVFFNFNNLFLLNFTIFFNFNMISDGNIYISCFPFFPLDRPFLVHPSIILWLILKIKMNAFFGCFLQLAKLQRQNYFLDPCIYILYSESGKVILSLACI